jgi:hypothetical protein
VVVFSSAGLGVFLLEIGLIKLKWMYKKLRFSLIGGVSIGIVYIAMGGQYFFHNFFGWGLYLSILVVFTLAFALSTIIFYASYSEDED